MKRTIDEIKNKIKNSKEKLDLRIDRSKNCKFCGKCIEACSKENLYKHDATEKILEKINDPNIYVIVQTAPSIRAALGEEFGMPIGTNVKGKMITALKELGFDKVFDTNTGADFTIMEEANEFVDRLKNNDCLPMITSCCPAWVLFAEKNYPELLSHLSTCKSPHQMFGAIIKSYFAKKYNINPDKIYTVSIMPCIVKKCECQRKEMEVDGKRDVDAVITTRELADLIKQKNIKFTELEDSEFDNPMGEASGAGAIFGTTGGVMEAAIRTAADLLEGRDIKKIDYEQIRGEKGIKTATLTIADKEINICVVSGLKNAKTIMDEIKKGKSNYQFIEIMACPGGCIMGAGQPMPIKNSKIDVRKLRADALYRIDEKSVIRKAHQNTTLQQVYKEFFQIPGGELAYKYLHTKYHVKQKIKFNRG